MPAFIDHTGKRFGRLVVLKRANEKGPKPKWLCLCDCGRQAIASACILVSGKQTSCGCRKDELTAERSYRHGHAARGKLTPEYVAWWNMRMRCSDRHRRDYPLYGGRGIRVCDRWLNSFNAFLADMGPRPSREHSIDRKNADGDYEPDNCHWATRKQQGVNRRTTKINQHIEIIKSALPFAPAVIAWRDLASATGIPRPSLHRRLRELLASGAAAKPAPGCYCR